MKNEKSVHSCLSPADNADKWGLFAMQFITSIINLYAYHQFKCKVVYFSLQALQVWRLVYSPEFVTLHYPLNLPLLPAASYLHLTASKMSSSGKDEC